MPMNPPHDRLGSFYLGAEYDLEQGKRDDAAPIDYDARDLVTHAVCVGMTGSGKTGLCVGLLEEAALDKVPANIIDPKGDMTNLLLQFPEMRPEDFLPWVNIDDARRKGKTPEEFATGTAQQWAEGLADWGIDPKQRISTLLDTVKYTVFTPGSDSGTPISILGSRAAPDLSWDEEGEAIRERIGGTVAALLALVQMNVDPVRSREAILLANIFEHYWRQNQDIDLATLITSIQKPPVRQLGVFDVDTFFPEKDRFALAVAFNSLMAAPTFQAWLQGEPLDVDRLLYTADGAPRHSIIYLAHLSDSERMFIVTLLLENVITWMRRQSGTTSLRALLYFDEVFGYFPPTAEPPSKRPLLTLLKQARAFGLGVVLVTQNPVDIDYKGLTNAGTWFIGKLQAERDKERLIAGLRGAISEAGGNANVDYNSLINRLSSRIFLMNNVHADGPVVFHTRWAQSYLRGPLTRPQVKKLPGAAPATQPAQAAQPTLAEAAPAPTLFTPDAQAPFTPRVTPPPAPAPSPAPSPAAPAAPAGFNDMPPTLDPAVKQVYLPLHVSQGQAARILESEGRRVEQVESIQLIYEPYILGEGRVRFVDRGSGVDKQNEFWRLAEPPRGVGGVSWAEAEPLSMRTRELDERPAQPEGVEGPFFRAAPEGANTPRALKGFADGYSEWLYNTARLSLYSHPGLKVTQMPGESERDFRIRVQQAAREKRDAEIDKLETKIETQIDRLREKQRKEEADIAKAKANYESRRMQEVVGVGETVLGYILGRKRGVSGLSRAASNRRMTSQAGMNIELSEQEVEEIKGKIAEAEVELKEMIEEIAAKWEATMEEVSETEIKPRRSDVQVGLVTLAWAPHWVVRYHDGMQADSRWVSAYAPPTAG